MLQSVFENIVAGLACTAICAAGKWMYTHIKSSSGTASTQNKRYTRKSLYKHFFSSLIALVISLPWAFGVHAAPFSLLGLLKVMLFFCAGMALILLWGVFDAAMAFYPPDDSTGNSKSDQAAHDARKD